MGLEVKFSYLQGGIRRAVKTTVHAVAYLHTLKLSTSSVLNFSGTDNIGSLADTDISDLAFVNQLFKFLPRGVGIRSQFLINDGLPRFPFLLERNRPAAHSSTLKIGTDDRSAYQWMR